MIKLNQVIAVEKGVKARTYATATYIYKTFQRAAQFDGLTRNYEPVNDGDTVYPSESTKVQFRVNDLLSKLKEGYVEYLDVTAQKDYANTSAKADVKIGDTTLISDAPVPFLLFLEKQLTDIKTNLSKIPTLAFDTDWSYDSDQGVYRSDPVQKVKTKKTQRPLVLAPATEKHPAQTQLVTEDVTEGHWTTTKLSGAIPPSRLEELLKRVEALLTAVKFAREQANMTDAPKVQVGETLFSFIFD